jgi:endonuclease YncB( thermonuclease family)
MKPIRFTFAAFAVLLLLSRLIAAEATLTGLVVGVADGDTLTILTAEKKQVKIRLEGIDAPEDGQDFGTKAKQALSGLVFGKQVKCVESRKDRFGRTLANVYLGERWINLELVESGNAWHFTKYSGDKRLAAAEKEARAARKGLWQQANAIPPWEYRKPASDESDTAVYVTETGTKYHRATCRHLSKSKVAISLDEAKRKYEPCKECKPPH